MCDSNEGVWSIMPLTVWFCSACRHNNLMDSVVCEHCGLPRDGDVSKTFEVVKRAMNTLEITGIMKDNMGSLHIKVEGVIDAIHLQAAALANDNRKPSFIVVSQDVYDKMCYELTSYCRCPTWPIEYNGLQIVIDTFAEPTTLRVLPEVPRHG